MSRRLKIDLAVVAVLLFAGAVLYPWGRRQYYLTLLRSPNPDQAMQSAQALRAMGPRAAPALTRVVLTSAHAGARNLALHALLDTGNAAPAPLAPEVRALALRVAAADWDQEAQSYAIERLARARVPQAQPLLRTLARDARDPVIRQDAIRGLLAYGDAADLPLLAGRLGDPDPDTAATAALAVSRLSGITLSLPRGDDAAARREAIAAWRAAFAKSPLATQATGAPELASLGRYAPIPGPPAPAFDVPRVGGGRLALADFRGTPVLVNVWASWCTPCKKEIPDLIAVAGALGDGVAIVGLAADFKNDVPAQRALEKRGVVNTGGDGYTPEYERALRAYQLEEIQRAMKAFGITYPVGIADDATMDRLDAYAVPTSIVVGPDGRIRRRIVGPRTGRYFTAVLRAAGA